MGSLNRTAVFPKSHYVWSPKSKLPIHALQLPIYKWLCLLGRVSCRNFRKLHQLLNALHSVEYLGLDFIIVLALWLLCVGLNI